ncbi:AraC family transcriptional regulator [Amylibacter sp. SFDW26]|nr:AraC family transcriptional regulator [Amylibacter sp. SFDW26]KAB7614003.1 AraC family transcriptional regulator [Amylibacter sp. SFDW26]
MLDLLSDILTKISLQGTLYFRTAFTKPWGVAVPSFENVARFHYAHRGDCLISVDGVDEPTLLAQGDLIIIPHGSAHSLYCGHDPENTILPLDEVLERSGFDGSGVLVFGGDEDERETQLICGHFSFVKNANHMLLERLPPIIHIRNYGEASGKWMESTLRMIGDETGGVQIGGDLIALKMSEVIFAQAIRSYLDSDASAEAGLAGFSDPHISRALDAFHKKPTEGWSVESLAREAGLSRTGFAVLFSKKMGVTPMQYVTSWRMELAKQILADHKISLAELSDLVGYASESAFARVFKKEVGFTPAGYRNHIQ